MCSAASNNREIRQWVLDALEHEPGIDSTTICVAGYQGAATLSGQVETCAQQLDTQRAAWRARGVNAVVQSVDVHAPDEAQTDEDLARRAAQRLQWDAAVPQDIRLHVVGGWLTLEGEVGFQHERVHTERSLRFLRGVNGVNNLIGLKVDAQPNGSKPPINTALKSNAEVEARLTRVDVRDRHTVMLEGDVDSWAEHAAAERAAWAVPRARVVVDRLSIA